MQYAALLKPSVFGGPIGAGWPNLLVLVAKASRGVV